MKKIFLLACANLNKHKWHTISFVIMITLAMSMLVAGLVTYFDGSENYERRCRYLNTEDCMFAISNNAYSSDILKDIEENNKIAGFEQKDIMLGYTTYKLAEGKVNRRITFLRKNLEDKMGRSEMIETSDEVYSHPIYLPILFRNGGGYQLGDNFTFEIDKKEYTFQVQGFFDNITLGSINVITMGFMFDDKEYDHFQKATSGAYDANLLLMKMKDREDGATIVSDLYSKYNVQNCVCVVNSYAGNKSARTFMSKIVAAIIVTFSFMVVIIAMVVIRFRIINSIQDDIKSIGTLKAMGYTNHDLINTYVLQFFMVSVVGILLGLGAALLVLPVIAKVLEAQSGMIWSMHINPVLVLLIILVIVFAVYVTILLSTRRIKKLSPITALRSGIETHSFRKNHFPFHRTKGNVNLIFGLKNFVLHKHQNIMIGGIITVITFVVLFAYSFYYNMAVDNSALIETVLGEVASVEISLKEEDTTFLNKVTSDSRVRKALYWATANMFVEGREYYTYITDDYSKCDGNLCYKGRSPVNDNEIAIGGLSAQELGKNIGDEIEMSIGDKKYTYLISGFTQSGNNLGYDAELTTEGMANLSATWKQVKIYVYLTDESQIDAYIADVKNEFGSNITNAISIKEVVDTQIGGFVDIATLLTTIILIFTCFVITLVLYLVIKTMLNKSKLDLGIQKALGYSTKQLILQMGLSFIPVALIGTTLGCMISFVAVSPLFSAMLQSLGIMKLNLIILPISYIVIVLILSIYTVLIALAMSVRIRKISAYKLINAE